MISLYSFPKFSTSLKTDTFNVKIKYPWLILATVALAHQSLYPDRAQPGMCLPLRRPWKFSWAWGCLVSRINSICLALGMFKIRRGRTWQTWVGVTRAAKIVGRIPLLRPSLGQDPRNFQGWECQVELSDIRLQMEPLSTSAFGRRSEHLPLNTLERYFREHLVPVFELIGDILTRTMCWKGNTPGLACYKGRFLRCHRTASPGGYFILRIKRRGHRTAPQDDCFGLDMD